VDERIPGMLCAELAGRREWDEPPELYALIHDDGDLRLMPMGYPSFIWNNAEPGSVLQRMAANAESWPPAALGAFVLVAGVAFRFEAWGVRADLSLPGDVQERLRRAAAEHDLHLQPERVEQRCMMAATADGLCWVTQERGGTPAVADEGPPQGRVPDALTRIAASWAGHEPPR
jgi:hypothetical protein